MDEYANFKVNPASLKIDPSLGIIAPNTQIPEIPQPQDPSQPNVGALTPGTTGRAQRLSPKMLRRQPGSTLAEQFGGASEGQLQAPAPERIVPRVSRAVDTSRMFEPKAITLPEESSTAIGSSAARTERTPSVSDVVGTQESESPKGLDLRSLVTNTVTALGTEAAAQFFGRSESLVKKWLNNGDPPISAAQRILNRSPKAQKTYLKVLENIDWEKKIFGFEHVREDLSLDLCLSIKDDVPFYVCWPWILSVANYQIGIKAVPETILPRSRNLVAHGFLKGTAQWSLWIDSDIIPTIGDPGWYRAIVRDPSLKPEMMSFHFIKRLLSHNKAFVGGVYSTRRRDGPLVIQPDLHPRNKTDIEISNAIRKCASSGLYEVAWLNAGLCLIHRSVFNDVRKANPDREPKTEKEPYPFFSTLGNDGEDKAFSELAARAGYKLYLDTELFAAHLGRWAYMPSMSQYNGPLEVTA
jgi:hypothetical protein